MLLSLDKIILYCYSEYVYEVVCSHICLVPSQKYYQIWPHFRNDHGWIIQRISRVLPNPAPSSPFRCLVFWDVCFCFCFQIRHYRKVRLTKSRKQRQQNVYKRRIGGLCKYSQFPNAVTKMGIPASFSPLRNQRRENS